MKKVITFGVFDLFHLGHLNLLKSAKKQGDYLIVAVHNDINKTKNVEYFYSIDERVFFVSQLSFVDEVIIYERVDEVICDNVEFDIFVKGPDQNHIFFQKSFDWCKKNNKKVVLSRRTEGISSSRIRDFISKYEV